MYGYQCFILFLILYALCIHAEGHIDTHAISSSVSEVKFLSRKLSNADENVVEVQQNVKDVTQSSINNGEETVNHEKNDKTTLGFVHAFLASLSVIIVSELGDKTFFIAAIMAMRYSRLTVFSGAIAALGLMTVLSACLGLATTIIPRWFTYYLSTLLFAIFGLRMLQEGIKMRPDEGQEELEEVQAELKKKEEELEREATATIVEDPESGIIRGGHYAKRCWGLLSPILVQAFTLTFLAEWGDRSQLTTIILGARENVLGVVIGGTLGHALCTGLAVIGGRMIAQKISVRTVTIIGGVVFLLFAVSSLFISPDSKQ
uniref:transmembrane protein 165-like n=1 Tax=Styela clava TaxID=7725 RepID=UPI0019392D2B|nr:transmembrane protein 165-like [Styela clava]